VCVIALNSCGGGVIGDQPIARSSDPGVARSSDQQIARSSDQQIARSSDQKIARSSDCMDIEGCDEVEIGYYFAVTMVQSEE
jgi:hypothetical protein